MSTAWGYTEQDGPATWAEKFPAASGSRQSPVDIDTSSVMFGSQRLVKRRPLTWSYQPASVETLSNTGHGWKVDVDSNGSELLGGPLLDKYQLAQFHCHWGNNSTHGSEHTVDGEAYAAELHLVHWNSGKYATIAEASSKPDGLAVLGVLLKVGESHPEIEKIAKMIPKIPFKAQTVPIRRPINIDKLLPASRCYWSYLGSLTTPPCSEVVTWILFKDPVEVSEQQLEEFRRMKCYGKGEDCPCDELNGLIINNYRPPLAIGDRILSQFIF